MHHLIQSQQIELSLTGDEQAAFGIQERTSHFFQTEMLPQMAKVMDQWVSEDEYWHIDRIELDLGVLAEDEFFSALSLDRLAERLALALQEQVASKIPAKSGSPQAQLRLWQIWTHFLRKGSLPWYVRQLPDDHADSLIKSLKSNPQLPKALLSLLQRDPVARQRFASQMNEHFIIAVLHLYEPNLSSKAEKLWQGINKTVQHQNFVSKQSIPTSRLLGSLSQKYWAFQLSQIMPLTQKITQKTWETRTLSYLTQSLPAMPLAFWQEIESVIPQAKSIALQGRKSGDLEPELLSNNTPSQESLRLDPHKEKVEGEAFGEAGHQEKGPISAPTESKHRKAAEPAPEQGQIIDRELAKDQDPSKQENKSESETSAPPAISEAGQGDQVETFAKKTEVEDEKSLEVVDPLDLPLRQAWTDNNLPPKAVSGQLLPDQEHFLPHAGVVLCHAYLASFWQNLDWIERASFKDLSSQEQAVLSLHYLATGERLAPEYQLTLPKILSGLPLNHPLNIRLELREDEAQEAENLLAAIVQNWGALGEVSNDSLREGFLKRAGKLSLKSGRWHLQMERKTIDILLDRLPWSIGIVKLPWMPDPIMVDWN